MKIKKEMTNIDVSSKKDNLQKYRKEKQAKLIELNETASNNIASLNKVLEVVKKGLGLSVKLTKSDLKDLSVEELNELLQKCNKAVSDFELIASKLKSVSNSVEKTLDEFKKTKKEVIQSGKMINELNASVEQSAEEKKEKIEAIKAEMKDLEKVIPTENINKYKELKENKIFPVLTKLNDKSCTACGMKLSEKNLEEIDSKSYTICETCHRIVVKD
ncbi:MAG: hypothetical protein IJW82_07100, partial [Clostridia bacterium]|nr:hypothetical protein [Clostridia bacterium]